MRSDTVKTNTTASEAKRVSLACQRCRYSKLKCSGTQPCDRCARKSRECHYDEPFNQHRNLEGRTRKSSPPVHPQNLSNKRRRLNEDGVQARPYPDRHLTLPSLQAEAVAAESPATYQRNRPNKRRRWLYLGVSSTASFNVRIAALIQASLGDGDSGGNNITFTLDGDAYKVSWDRLRSNELPDLTDLPSVDYAIYLMNTVKFHLDALFRLYDEDEFVPLLHEFYADASRAVRSNRLWFTQYLLMMAFGKGILNTKRTPGFLAGSDLFCRAMAVLPELSALHEEPVLAVEVLCLVALYLYCLDMRQTAYSYVGQALRIALVEGNHTYLHGSQLGQKLAQRCANVWWTVYILDRTLSSVVGVPPSISDKHIKNSLPQVKQSSQRDATLGLHVKLSRLISDILTELYSADGSLETSYLAKTRSVLRDMAQVGEEIEETIDFKFKNSLDTVSKGATHLRLMYHQVRALHKADVDFCLLSKCIILATRPLLLCLLQEKLKPEANDENGQLSVLPSVQDLLQTCAESATKTLRMLAALNRNNMLDCFLPFNLDFACSAASSIILVHDILRCMNVDVTAQKLIDKILNEMISAGNSAAVLRQKELQQLRHLGKRMWSSRPQTSITSTQHTSPQDIEAFTTENPNEPSASADTYQHATTSPFTNAADETMTQVSSGTAQELAQNFDLSYEQMLSVADQLDIDAFSSNMEFNEFGRLDWLELGF